MEIKSKKGFLLGEHTIGIIVAVLCLIILVYLGFKLTGIANTQSDMKKAELHMNNIIEKIELLKVKSGGEEIYDLNSPNGWVLVGWPNDLSSTVIGGEGQGNAEFPYGDKIPDICKKNNWQKCLCLCKSNFLDILSDCSIQGVCKPVDGNLNLIVNIDSSNNKKLSINIDDLIKSSKNIEFKLDNNVLTINKEK